MRMRAYSPDTRTLCPSWRHSRNFCCSAGTVAAHKSRSLGSIVRSAVLDQETPTSSEPRAVISHLVGKKLLQLSPHHSTVPLLHPLDHSLPFAAALQVYNSSTTAGLSPLTSAAPSNSGSDLVELHYVISGSGHFSNPALGIQQTLLPGDSVIALHGAASFAAGPLPDIQQDSTAHLQQQQQHQQQDLSQQDSSTPAWSHLLGWLQQLHNKQYNVTDSGRTPQSRPVQQQQQGPLAFGDLAAPSLGTNASTAAVTAAAAAATVAGQGSNQLVTLQLLLPSELLTGQMLSHHAGHCQAVAQQLPWSAQPGQAAGVGPCELLATGSIHEQEVCGLLVDASLSSQHTAVQHQQQHQQPGSNLHLEQPQHSVLVTIDQGMTHNNSTSSSTVAATETSSKDSSSSFQSSASHSPALSTLPTLSQDQIVKRALSEVGAFRLPQQTNRLALLFGPHSSPAVSLSFGVEVFEPGHVTPLHIHKQAHELFLVLGGKGQAVYHCSDSSSSGSSSEQRVEVSPGDVAVFAPGVLHGIDNASSDQLYCLQMMLPNEAFVEWVQSGEAAGSLDVSALQRMAAAASCG